MILTPNQKKFLDFLNEDEYLVKKYYFTGGTALSQFYLQHRFSEDLDFFIKIEEVNMIKIKSFIKKIGAQLKLQKIEFREIFGVKTVFLHFFKDEVLKIDFNYYPFPRIEKGIKYKNIAIDSIYDIAVNKVHTILMRTQARDFIDIYFIIKEKNYSFKKLLLDAKAKFDWHIDAIHLGSRLMLANEMKDLPRMIKNIDHKEWQNFFVNEAYKLRKEIFR
ncbi:MAG: nucleotidyl transferase AbiEii/AbiGii toxin family protein [Bacteroidia bacterium]|nr:nucleotidyl transferase AbiEii/AbiGii toxin family protein [Bacteroidia bacterium]